MIFYSIFLLWFQKVQELSIRLLLLLLLVTPSIRRLCSSRRKLRKSGVVVQFTPVIYTSLLIPTILIDLSCSKVAASRSTVQNRLHYVSHLWWSVRKKREKVHVTLEALHRVKNRGDSILTTRGLSVLHFFLIIYFVKWSSPREGMSHVVDKLEGSIKLLNNSCLRKHC